MNVAALTPAQASAFFERYKSEFDECNWSAFVSLFHEPAVSVRGDGSVKLLASRSDALAFFRSVSESWRAEGYSRFSTSDLVVTPLGSRSGLVTFTWRMERVDGSIIKQWRQSYQLVLVGQEWRVLASTFHAPWLTAMPWHHAEQGTFCARQE